ncbi:SaV-like [uncultured Caudovirales phage]|uniref:SaV-like n=1 Tax=uncultured Caudovirales phage TaxID=2100421 RepID=A0A6J5LKH6_9CAUD|nr:SaV-like [uncultured Caudovirales phage]
MNDRVNKPVHYTRHPSGVECIEITQHMGFCLGNAVKYCWRSGQKEDEVEDLLKAKWYANRAMTRPYMTHPIASSWDIHAKHQLHLFLAMEEDGWRREAIRALCYGEPLRAIQFIDRRLGQTTEVV